jgi:DNA repair protein RecN (Recombination protein N)
MLKSLHISNFALIDELNVSFDSGLSIITGETGAGKSIILGAIDLLCGKRADSKSLKDKSKKATVEAAFDISEHKGIKRKLQELEYDIPEDEILYLSRELSPSGRSRAFLNDTPVNLQTMGEIAASLLDVHSQHQTQAIVADAKVRLRFVDALASDKAPLANYKALFNDYRSLRNTVRTLRDELTKNTQKRDFLNFQLTQLNKLNLKLGEQKQLEALYNLKSKSQQITDHLTESLSLLSSNSTDDTISRIEKSLSLIRKVNAASIVDNTQHDIESRLNSLLIDLKDIVGDIEALNDKVENNPTTLKEIEDRLNEIYEAQLQFKVKDSDELVAIKQNVESQLKQISQSSTSLPKLENELKLKGKKLQEAASVLTKQRANIAVDFSTELQNMAKTLGLANLKFKIDIKEAKLSSDGADLVEFLCAFNKNQQYMYLQDTASGGEASRLMLCMKAIIAGKTEMPTLIFDEIDTGISGEIANKAGNMMRDIASKIQVIAITHLPQVAVAGHSHYKVYKQDTETETLTQIKRLTEEERRVEIAKMLSGASIDEAALENASSLLKEASKY